MKLIDQIDEIIKIQKEKILEIHKKLGEERESKIVDGAKERWKNKRKGKAGKLKNLEKYRNKVIILIASSFLLLSFNIYAKNNSNSISTQYDKNTEFFKVNNPVDTDKYLRERKERIEKMRIEKERKQLKKKMKNKKKNEKQLNNKKSKVKETKPIQEKEDQINIKKLEKNKDTNNKKEHKKLEPTISEKI